MKKILFLTIMMCATLVCSSQKMNIKKADALYDGLSYMDAITVYERVVDKGYGTAEIYQKLGDSYYFNGDYIAANKWYDELFKDPSKSVEPELYYRYSQSLKSVGENDKANEYLDKFSQKAPGDPRSRAYKQDADYLATIAKVSNRYQIEDSGINSALSDYGPAFYKNGIVYASTQGSGKVHAWTNQAFSDLYFSATDTEGKLQGSELFDKKINSKFNESTPAFTKDGKTMYFTRNNFLDGKKGSDAEQTILLKIYSAKLNDKGKWADIKELPFNSNAYNTAHPALSADEKVLYFSSDMPDGFGNSDLYKIDILEGGAFGTPENLGRDINTPGRETFPFISTNNELYFASDGHLGLGGLDIFGVLFREDASISKIYNLGKPVNTEFDDFSYIINNDTKVGYYSSNKTSGAGFDDIYKFTEDVPLPFDCQQQIAGVITDSKTNLGLSNVTVTLLDAKMQSIATTITDQTGAYTFADKVGCDTKYFVRAILEKYDAKEISVTTPLATGITRGDIALVSRFTEIKENIDLAKVYGIENIYFDLDKWNITKKAEEKLAVLLSVLEEYPAINVDVRSHTDCRQTVSYNQRLSERRAKSTIAWLVKKGIKTKRLTGKGYGESQLTNNCPCEPTNASNCSEDEHQANRRSEFIIVK